MAKSLTDTRTSFERRHNERNIGKSQSRCRRVWKARQYGPTTGAKIAVSCRRPREVKLYVAEATAENSDGCKIYIVDVATGEARPVAVKTQDQAEYGPHRCLVGRTIRYVYYVKGGSVSVGCRPGFLYRVHPDGTGDEKIADVGGRSDLRLQAVSSTCGQATCRGASRCALAFRPMPDLPYRSTPSSAIMTP